MTYWTETASHALFAVLLQDKALDFMWIISSLFQKVVKAYQVIWERYARDAILENPTKLKRLRHNRKIQHWTIIWFAKNAEQSWFCEKANTGIFTAAAIILTADSQENFDRGIHRLFAPKAPPGKALTGDSSTRNARWDWHTSSHVKSIVYLMRL